jgi:conjugal transfer pilin signal peptidase TrbI
MSVVLDHRINSAALRAYMRVVRVHVRQYGVSYAAVLGALWVFHTHFAVGVNATPSLPYTVCLITKGDLNVQRGDLVAFRWHGGGPYPAGMIFTKVIRGLPGDEVSRSGQLFLVNGERVGWAKPFSTTREPLTPGPTGVIPDGHYYVAGTHRDSLDSRYALAGWIRRDALIGRAHVVF